MSTSLLEDIVDFVTMFVLWAIIIFVTIEGFNYAQNCVDMNRFVIQSQYDRQLSFDATYREVAINTQIYYTMKQEQEKENDN